MKMIVSTYVRICTYTYVYVPIRNTQADAQLELVVSFKQNVLGLSTFALITECPRSKHICHHFVVSFVFARGSAIHGSFLFVPLSLCDVEAFAPHRPIESGKEAFAPRRRHGE